MVWGELDAQRRPPVDDDGVPVDVTLDRAAVHGRPETALSLQIGGVEHDGGPLDVHGPHATTHLRQEAAPPAPEGTGGAVRTAQLRPVSYTHLTLPTNREV